MRLVLLVLIAGCQLSEPADQAQSPPSVGDAVLQEAEPTETSEPAAPPAPVPHPLYPDVVSLDSAAFAARVAAVDSSVARAASVFTTVGVYHDGEAPARDGERWQAITPLDSATFALRPVTVSVAVAQDELLDPDEGPFTGRLVTTSATVERGENWFEDPGVVFVRRASGPFPEGPLETAAADVPLVEPRTLDLPLGDDVYQLEIVAGPVYPHGGYPRVVTLVGPDGRRQPLAYLPDLDGARELFWAGDLDGDGLLDLVLDESWHYNLSAPTLHLSTEAPAGTLVGRAARHETTGC